MDDKTKHINASGFPLQIGLAHAIEASGQSHGWKVLHQEHGWDYGEESGFIDLVLENQYQTVILNVECKRPQDAIWQFLLPKPAQRQTTRCEFWTTFISKDAEKYFDWLDSHITPASYESEFCVVAGQDTKNRPMLERIGAAVVTSTRALAIEDRQLLKKINYERLRTYINVVATTAKLEVCKFNAETVDLGKGTLDVADYEQVPYIRFRKQLAPRAGSEIRPTHETDWQALSKAKENTVLVVEAAELIGLLSKLELDKSIGHVIQMRY